MGVRRRGLFGVRVLGYGARVTTRFGAAEAARGDGGLCPHPPKGLSPFGIPGRCGGAMLVRSGARGALSAN